jgi:hypothetical protein
MTTASGAPKASIAQRRADGARSRGAVGDSDATTGARSSTYVTRVPSPKIRKSGDDPTTVLPGAINAVIDEPRANNRA